MQVSFIIPLFNCLTLTQECTESLVASLPGDLSYEIILVDDGSTDGTRAWLSTLQPPFRIILNESNLGYAGANNRGANVAQGEALLLLNNDLIFKLGWLEPMLSARKRLNPQSAIIGNVQVDAQSGGIDHTGIFINPKGKPEHDRSIPHPLLRTLFPVRNSMAVTGACMMIDRSLWEQLGGFDENYANGAEDVDLCLRARAEGHKTYVTLKSIIRHHISASPGRKTNDERNSRRLAKKWREELVLLGAREWCWEYLRVYWTAPQSSRSHSDARQALFYALHVKATPPAVAINGMNAALDVEFSRWDQLLGPQN